MDPRIEQLLNLLGFRKKEDKGKKKPDPKAAKPDAPKADAGPKPATAFNLDASAFLPITTEELKAGLRDLLRSGGSRFVGRGMIPFDDDRSRLINRSMLSDGFLSPEQLAAILEIAPQFEELQKALARIEGKVEKSAEKAVELDKEERARIKAEKKAASLEKKRLYAEGVAKRKATDIVFLGPRVSSRLNQRESDADKLAGYGMPVMSTPADLAKALGIEVSRLRWLAYHTEVATRLHYVQFLVPKRSGGTRMLSAPHKSLAATQQWIYKEIVTKLPVESPAHGFVTGRSIVTNAQPHVGQAVLLNMDLEGFFPSIAWQRARSVFHRAGYSPCVATILALLCTECPREAVEFNGVRYYVATGPRGLPQGASTSPGLSNQVARKLDKRLNGLAVKLGLTYTRYADDLTFSGPAEFNERVGYLIARVRHIALEEGFSVNEKKTRVLRKSAQQSVTGVVVNEKASLPREELRKLRAILHRAGKEGLEAQNREGRPNYRAWLAGKIAYVRMVRPDLGAKMLSEFEKLA